MVIVESQGSYKGNIITSYGPDGPRGKSGATMKISTESQTSSLCNHDVKWYLPDEQLWVTKYNEYAEIEDSIETSVGSFNWLYELNDTILFHKNDGKFETAIIDLSGKIKIGNTEDVLISIKRKEKGELFLAEKRNCNFEFSPFVTYVKNSDYLSSLPPDKEIQDLSILFIVDDFGFIIFDNQLEGWILKNASRHIHTTQINETISDNNPELLAMYLNALNLLEKDQSNTEELKKLLESIRTKRDMLSLAIRDSINNIFW